MSFPTSAAIRDRRVALALCAGFALLLAVSWQRWGHVRIDAGGALDRAARIAHGAVLYRDVLSPYGPLPDYAVATAFRLFGVHLAVVYAIGIAVLAAESLLLWRIASQFLTRFECAVGLAAFWLLFAFAPGPFGWVLPNVFASTLGCLAATAALALAIEAVRGPRRRWMAASLCAAAAGLSKPEFGFAAIATLLAAVWLAPVDRPRALAAALLPGLLVALVVATLLCTVVDLRVLVFDNLYRTRSFSFTVQRLRDALPDTGQVLREAVVRYGIEFPLRAGLVAAGGALGAAAPRWRFAAIGLIAGSLALPLLPGYPRPQDFIPLEGAARGFGWSPAVWVVLLVLLARGVLDARTRQPATVAIVLAAIWSVSLSLRWQLRLMWPSYYGVLAPFLLILVVRRLLVAALPGRTAWAAAAVVAVHVGATGMIHGAHFRALYTHALSYPRGTIRTYDLEGRPMARVIDYVRAHTTPDAYVAVLPEESLINFLSERRSPTQNPGVGPGWLATAADEEAFLAELEQRDTQLVIVSTRRYPEFGARTFEAYSPRLMAYIETHWQRLWTTDDRLVNYLVYGRTAGARPPLRQHGAPG